MLRSQAAAGRICYGAKGQNSAHQKSFTRVHGQTALRPR